MAEPKDDAPDLSRDNKLKKVFRGVTEWLYDQKKPTPREEMPWYYPNKHWDGWFDNDPITVPGPKYPLEREAQLRYMQPLFNLPITDMLATPLMRQHNQCAHLEMKCLECIEYYGAHRGTVLCQDYYDDWHECAGQNLTKLRARAMQMQYLKKYYEYVRGERDYSTVYQKLPAPQAFHEPLRTHKNDFSDGQG